MNPLQVYNFVPTTVDNNQFLTYKQPAYYMTDYRNSTDLYAYLINNANKNGVTTGHQLRQYMQDNAGELSTSFLQNSYNQFMTMQVPGAPNVCSGAMESPIYNGGSLLVNSSGVPQIFPKDCTDNSVCGMFWDNTPLPQQGPHCRQ
jgi:hypothetical protein